MHAHQKVPVVSGEEQKRMYEKFVKLYEGRHQGKLGRQRDAYEGRSDS